MNATPDLMGIPRELRFNIIDYVSDNTNRRPQIPCHRSRVRHDSAGGWQRIENGYRIPKGVKHLVALMRANKTLHAEVNEQFFSKAIVNFCSSHRNSIATINGIGQTFSAYNTPLNQPRHGLEAYLQNATTVTYKLWAHPGMLFEIHSVLGLSDFILRGQAMMDHQRYFVNALNKSRFVKTVNICCSFRNRKIYEFTSEVGIRKVFRGFENLRHDIKLNVHLHACDILHEHEVPLPMEGFPNQPDLEYIAALQAKRLDTVTANEGPLLIEWMKVQSWLFQTLPLWRNDVEHHLPGDGIPTIRNARIFLPDMDVGRIYGAVSSIWTAHDAGDGVAFAAGQQKLVEVWQQWCDLRARMLLGEVGEAQT